jgi:Family of unknown function (DUF6496)
MLASRLGERGEPQVAPGGTVLAWPNPEEALMKAKKRSPRKVAKGTATKVGKTMHERKHGELRTASTAKKATGRKRAIAVGLSGAGRDADKMPLPKRKATRRK